MNIHVKQQEHFPNNMDGSLLPMSNIQMNLPSKIRISFSNQYSMVNRHSWRAFNMRKTSNNTGAQQQQQQQSKLENNKTENDNLVINKNFSWAMTKQVHS